MSLLQGYNMRLKDLVASLVPPEKLGELEFAELHQRCRAVVNWPNGGKVSDLTDPQQEAILEVVNPVQRKLLGKTS